MSIVVRIVSADGKRSIIKTLPGLPARLKIPAGAKVEVTEDGHTKTLPQYVNEHSGSDKGKHQNATNVMVEQADSWEESEAWLNSFDGATPGKSDPNWFTTASDGGSPEVMGFQKDALLIGGLVAVGVGGGVYALTKGGKDGPKDITAPAAPTLLDLATDDDTGTSTTDNITNKTSGLTITGKAEANSTVELFNGTTSLGTATAGADGTFTKDVSLTIGEHTITAKATDKAGNVGVASASIKVTVDDNPPVAPTALDLATDDDTGASGIDNITTKTSGLTITGKGEVGAKIELFDGTTSLGTTTVGTTGNFTLDIALANGTHNITAKATDTAGNIGPASDALVIKVDTALLPVAPTSLDLAAEDDNGSSNSDNLTSLRSGLTISGNAPANTTVELFNGAVSLGSVSVGANGKWSKDITLGANGVFTITAKSTDSGGNVSVASDPFYITIAAGPTAPTSLDLATEDDNGSSTTDNITTITDDLTITGNADAGSTIQLFDGTTSLGTVVAGSDGRFSFDVDLAIGTHSITAKATSSTGYTSPASAVLEIKVEAPATLSSLFAATEETTHTDTNAVDKAIEALHADTASTHSTDTIDHSTVLTDTAPIGTTDPLDSSITSLG